MKTFGKILLAVTAGYLAMSAIDEARAGGNCGLGLNSGYGYSQAFVQPQVQYQTGGCGLGFSSYAAPMVQRQYVQRQVVRSYSQPVVVQRQFVKQYQQPVVFRQNFSHGYAQRQFVQKQFVRQPVVVKQRVSYQRRGFFGLGGGRRGGNQFGLINIQR